VFIHRQLFVVLTHTMGTPHFRHLLCNSHYISETWTEGRY